MRVLVCALIAVALSSPAWAAVEDEGDAPGCVVPVPITEALVRDAGMYDWSGFAGHLVGSLSNTRDAEDADTVSGTIIFARDAAGAWRAFLPRPGESVVGAYVAANGEAILATQWQSEGPGQSWTIVRMPASMESATCVEVSFPGDLNQPAWNNDSLDLTDLDIAANGRGEIIGVWRTENDGNRWYRYQTRDGGATWAPPRRISRERNARAGRFTPVDTEAPADAALVAALQQSVAPSE